MKDKSLYIEMLLFTVFIFATIAYTGYVLGAIQDAPIQEVVRAIQSRGL